MWGISEGVYHPGVKEGEFKKKDKTVFHTGSVP